jgi:hypothetical protein
VRCRRWQRCRPTCIPTSRLEPSGTRGPLVSPSCRAADRAAPGVTPPLFPPCPHRRPINWPVLASFTDQSEEMGALAPLNSAVMPNPFTSFPLLAFPLFPVLQAERVRSSVLERRPPVSQSESRVLHRNDRSSRRALNEIL